MQTLEEEEATTKDIYKITGEFIGYNTVSVATILMTLEIELIEKLIKITNSECSLIITLLTETFVHYR